MEGLVDHDTASKVWFKVARGSQARSSTRASASPNIQHMRYVITGGATFVDPERDAFTVALGYRIDAASLTLSAAASRSSPDIARAPIVIVGNTWRVERLRQ
jgi:hypothetical protein